MALQPHEDLFPAPFYSGFPAFSAHHPLALALGSDAAQLLPRNVPMDVVEKDDKFEVKADIPGVKKSEIHVHVDGDVLRISIERKVEKHEEHGAQKEQRKSHTTRIHRYERSEQFVGRALRLPNKVDADKITAKYEDGVLTLDVPKKQAAADPRRVAVE